MLSAMVASLSHGGLQWLVVVLQRDEGVVGRGAGGLPPHAGVVGDGSLSGFHEVGPSSYNRLSTIVHEDTRGTRQVLAGKETTVVPRDERW